MNKRLSWNTRRALRLYTVAGCCRAWQAVRGGATPRAVAAGADVPNASNARAVSAAVAAWREVLGLAAACGVAPDDVT